MQLIADEDIDKPVVDILRREGFDVLSVDEEIKGASDQKVIRKAVDEKRVLVTMDSDFIDTDIEHYGVIRITSFAAFSTLAETIIQVLDTHSREDLKNTVVQTSPKRNYDF